MGPPLRLVQTRWWRKLQEVELRRRGQGEVQLSSTKSKLEEKEAAKEVLQKKYDDTVEKMEREMVDMESRYEAIINEALDGMSGKLEQAQARWERSCQLVQLRNIARLKEFGLPHLEL